MKISGELTFPGDKSISHRALILGTLTNGESTIDNCSNAIDVESTRLCLQECGVPSERVLSRITILGGGLKRPDHPLNCGNSGTTARLLTGLLVGQGVAATLVGDESLSRRPMGRIIRPLQMMGATVEGRNGHLPLRLKGKTPSMGIKYRPPVASAQVKSCVLLAGLGVPGSTTVIERTKTRDHTEIMLKILGADITTTDNHVTVFLLQRPFKPFHINVPGDPSTAAFLASAAAVIPHSELILRSVLLNPTRTGFYDALKEMGAGIQLLNKRDEYGETIGDLKITHKPLKGISLGGTEIPRMIDELPILGVLATQAEGTTVIRDAIELRVKETDRIKAICTNLRRMGAHVSEREDGFVIRGPTPLRGASISTFDDHRVAMAFTIAGLIAQEPVKMDNPEIMSVSCPDFSDLLRKVIS